MTTWRLAVNLQNDGTIPNLPPWAVVEVPATVAAGVSPVWPSAHSPATSRRCCTTAPSSTNSTLRAAVTGDRSMAVQALAPDPLVPDAACASPCSTRPSWRTLPRSTGSPDDHRTITRDATVLGPTSRSHPYDPEGMPMTTAETTPTSLGYTTAELDARGAGSTAREIAQQPGLWRQVGRDVIARRAETEAFLSPLLARPDLRILDGCRHIGLRRSCWPRA